MPLSEKELLITMMNKQKENERRNRENNKYYTCKTCGYTFKGKVNYCPNCGIKLIYK